MSSQMSQFGFQFFLFYLPLLFSLCVHEFSHGWMAKRRGDLTAFYQGRLTLNPLVHMDYLGTVILPLIFLWTQSPVFFGWAKPVPVDPHAFKNPKADMFWTAFAGPLSNFLLAFIGAGLLSLFYILQYAHILPAGKSLILMMEMLIYVNMLLGVFNLIPLHPLDGGKVLARFLPARWNLFLEENQNYGYMLLIAMVFLGGFHYLAKPIFFGSKLLIGMAQSLSAFLIKSSPGFSALSF